MAQSAVDKSFKKYADRILAVAEKRSQRQFNVLRKGLTTKIDNKIDDFKDEVRVGFNNVRSEFRDRFDTLDTKFIGLETKVDNLETRADSLDAKVDSIDEKVENLTVTVEETNRKLDLTFEKVGEIHEVRLQRLETA